MNFKIEFKFQLVILRFSSIIIIIAMTNVQNVKSEHCDKNDCHDNFLLKKQVSQTENSYFHDHSSFSSDNTNIPSPPSSSLIVYNEEDIPVMHRQERNISVGNHVVRIRQLWSTLGVAGCVWDAGIVLAEYLKNDVLDGLNVIDLGSGTGFLGIFASKMGARVTLTDLNECIPNMLHNVKINHVSHLISVRELKWGHNLSNFKDEYDIILGADIVYVEETFDDLLKTLLTISNCKTKIFLSCKIRYDKDSNFISKLFNYFTVKTVLYDTKFDITIYLATKICLNGCSLCSG